MPSLITLSRYGLPGFTLAFAALPLYLLTPALYAEQVGISLGAVGVVLMLTRLTDAIADPIIGRWMDQHQTGLWQWLCGGLIAMAIGLSLLVNPPASWLLTFESSDVLLLTWMGVMALLVSLANSVATLAHQSWAVAWTDQVTAQSRLIAGREVWALLGVITAAIIAAQRSGPAMAITVVVSAAAALALTIGLRRFGAQGRDRPRGPSALPWRAMLSFGEFRTLLAAFSVNALANAIPATLVLFFMADVLGATRDQSSALLAAYFLSAAASVMFWSWLASRWGAMPAWRLAMGIAVAAFIWTLALKPGDLTSFTVVCLATGFALGAELVCPPVLLGQVIAQRGHRGQLESSYFGIWNLVIKLALALAAGLTLPALSLMDYAPGQTGSAPLATTALQWTYAGVPCVLKCVAIIWLGRISAAAFTRKESP